MKLFYRLGLASLASHKKERAIARENDYTHKRDSCEGCEFLDETVHLND
jgi:hypothetical protein